MKLEVCVYSLSSAITAQHSGADTIELCGGQAEGGTTPSAGLITLVRKHVSLPIFVMIRPRGGDFLYSNTEFEVMRADIDAIKEMGVDGFVFGILNKDGSVDAARMMYLVEMAKPLPVTFHRAFDMSSDAEEAFESIVRCGCKRILTSGQEARAIEGIEMIRRLARKWEGIIEIVAGSGIAPSNALVWKGTGVGTLHLSAGVKSDGGMVYRKEGISMASTLPGEYERVEADGETIMSIADMIRDGSTPNS